LRDLSSLQDAPTSGFNPRNDGFDIVNFDGVHDAIVPRACVKNPVDAGDVATACLDNPGRRRSRADQQTKHLSKSKSCHENIILLESYLRDFPISFRDNSDTYTTDSMGKCTSRRLFMRDPKTELSKKALKKHSEYHYFTHDRRMSVWIWHQVILVEISGTWNPEVAKGHLDKLFGDFSYVRQYWNRAFAIIDLHRFEIQTVAFRGVVKNYWAKQFNRSDLVICFVENNVLRKAIRSAMLKLIPRSHNVHICTNYREISALILPLLRLGEVEVRR